MLICLILMLLQLPLQYRMLVEEDSRAGNPAVLLSALKDSDTEIQRLAVRALGRLERPAHAEAVRPFLLSTVPAIRLQAVNAMGQMNVPFDFRALLETESEGAVRGVIYETIGRMREVAPGTEEVLVRGLNDADPGARAGAAKGLEALFRKHAKTITPAASTLNALRQAFGDNTSAKFRELALLTLTAAGDTDTVTMDLALEDPEPQVRRLAVIATKQWRNDPSPIVRYEALRRAPSCDRANAALQDNSDHVALLAIDQLGDGCDAAQILEEIVDRGTDWRRQARALVSLARISPESARQRLIRFQRHPQWQTRTYLAAAAKILNDEHTLARLMEDPNPNVTAAAMSTPAHAVRGLRNSDYNLVLASARMLKDWANGAAAVPTLLSSLERITAEKRATSRDPRMEILQRIRQFGDETVAEPLRPLLSDFDPAVASLAAEIITEKTGSRTQPRTTRYVTPRVPPEPYIRGLYGATAVVRMRESGAFTLQLLPEIAPVTVAVFAQHAEANYYNGLTMHRVVPNFVLQGGSPGGNEYAGQASFMRDELDTISHERGTLGISTRGRDTGDAQIFINLVDNFRLDHEYTVFSRVTEGMENVDRIQEGDVIESIEIRRKVQPY